MKNLWIKILLIINLFATFFLFISHRKNPEKQAYIDNAKLLEKYEGMIDARKEMEKKTKMFQQNVDTLASEFQESLKKYERERNGMTEKERKLSEELLNNKQQQVLQYKDALEKKSKDESAKIAGAVLSRLNGYIKKFGKENGYKLIFGANESGNVVYADAAIDITDEVIEGANKEYHLK